MKSAKQIMSETAAARVYSKFENPNKDVENLMKQFGLFPIDKEIKDMYEFDVAKNNYDDLLFDVLNPDDSIIKDLITNVKNAYIEQGNFTPNLPIVRYISSFMGALFYVQKYDFSITIVSSDVDNNSKQNAMKNMLLTPIKKFQESVKDDEALKYLDNLLLNEDSKYLSKIDVVSEVSKKIYETSDDYIDFYGGQLDAVYTLIEDLNEVIRLSPSDSGLPSETKGLLSKDTCVTLRTLQNDVLIENAINMYS